MPSNVQVYRDPASGGNNTSLSLADDQRYALLHFSDLTPSGLAHTISSVELSRKTPNGSGGAESSLYLFAGNSQVQNWDIRRSIPYTMINLRAPVPFIQDFHGDFLRLTVPAGGGSFRDDLSRHSFNDKTTSLMLVNRWRDGKPEQTISAKNTITLGWKTALPVAVAVIQLALQGSVGITIIQDPVFTWVAFPVNQNLLSANQVYMVLSQWFVFHASGIGMNAWLQFYLQFSVVNNRLRLNVIDMDRYVWPGTGQGQLYQALDGNKSTIISALQTASASLLQGPLPQMACDDVYLLPGTQPDQQATGNETMRDDALNDVTIVIENPRWIN